MYCRTARRRHGCRALPEDGQSWCRANVNGVRPLGLKYSLGKRSEPLLDLQFPRKGPSLDAMKFASKDSRGDSQKLVHVVMFYCIMFQLKYKYPSSGWQATKDSYTRIALIILYCLYACLGYQLTVS